MNILVTGGAGFIGSTLVDRLMAADHTVTVVDNLMGGDRSFLAQHAGSPRFRLLVQDVRNTDALIAALEGANIELVYHLAANPDISRGIEDPTLDFENSIVATFSMLQAMRHHGIKKLFYTSGSGIYGDLGSKYIPETHGPLTPVSMYGASKMGAEALISAFVHLFGMQAWVLRPANIIGPRSTHGVVFDFIRKLQEEPERARHPGRRQAEQGVPARRRRHRRHHAGAAQGEGADLVLQPVVELVHHGQPIADLVIKGMKLQGVKRTHTPGKIGWKGDVPVVRLKNARLAKLGWKAKYDSARAVSATIAALLADPRFA